MSDQRLNTLPVSMERISSILNAKIVKLSDIISQTGLSEDQIFAIWGNKDGSVMACCDNGEFKYKIAYNDNMPKERIRFTLAEECCHIILNHTSDRCFNIFNQSYVEKTYNLYDEEARIAAGILLCPPQFYYKHSAKMTIALMCEFYQISEKCAHARKDIYEKYRYEIQSNSFYNNLPRIYINPTIIREVSLYKIIKNPETGKVVSIAF